MFAELAFPMWAGIALFISILFLCLGIFFFLLTPNKQLVFRQNAFEGLLGHVCRQLNYLANQYTHLRFSQLLGDCGHFFGVHKAALYSLEIGHERVLDIAHWQQGADAETAHYQDEISAYDGGRVKALCQRLEQQQVVRIDAATPMFCIAIIQDKHLYGFILLDCGACITPKVDERFKERWCLISALFTQTLVHMHTEKALLFDACDSPSNHCPARIVYWERDIVQGHIRLSNEAYHLLGLSSTQTLLNLKQLFSYVLEEDRKKLRQALAKARSQLQPLSLSFRIQRADNQEIRTLQTQSEFKLDAQGKPVAIVGFLSDITEQLVSQQMLERQEEEHRCFTYADFIH